VSARAEPAENSPIFLLRQARLLAVDPALEALLDRMIRTWEGLERHLLEAAGGGARAVVDAVDILRPLVEIDEALDEALERDVQEGPIGSICSQLADDLAILMEESESSRGAQILPESRATMEEALSVLAAYLREARTTGDQAGEAESLFHMGWVYDELRSSARALRCHRAALRLCSALGDQQGCAANLHMIGVGNRHLKRYANALDFLAQAIRLTEELGDRGNMALSQAEMGLVHEALGQLPDAERCLAAALAVFQSMGQREEAASCASSLHRVRERRSAGASEGANESAPAPVAEEFPEVLLAGIRLSLEGREREALAKFLRGAAACKQAANESGALICVSHAGQSLVLLGHADEGMELLQRAAREAAAHGDPAVRADVLSGLGEALRVQGRHEEALTVLQEATELSEQTGDPMARCIARVRFGETLKLLGRTSEALGVLHRATEDALQIEASPLTMQTRCDAFIDLGGLLRLLGRHRESLKWLERARIEAQQLGDPLTLCNALREHGATLLDMGRMQAALEALNAAADAAERITAPLSRLNTFTLLAEVHRHLESPLEALRALDRAFAEAHHVGDGMSIARLAIERAVVLMTLGRHADAIAAIDQATASGGITREPLTLCQVYRVRGTIAAQQADWPACRRYLREAEAHLSAALSQNRWPVAMGDLLSSLIDMFALGVGACEEEWKLSPELDLLWEGLELVDFAKCMSIREGMRRHGRRSQGSMERIDWHAGPPDWRHLFCPLPGDRETPREAAGLRGFRSAIPSFDSVDWELELPGEVDTAKAAFCQTFSRETLPSLFPEGATALVSLFFAGADLLILPVLIESGGSVDLRSSAGGYFRIPKVRRAVAALCDEIDHAIERSREERRLPNLRSFCTRLYETLCLRELLSLLEPDTERRRRLHLVIIPDGPLSRLPLHAALDPLGGSRFYEEFASFRYALSIRTLELQAAVEKSLEAEETPDRRLRGVAFAWPDRAGCFLPGVITEIQALIEETGPESWWVHGEMGDADHRATRSALRTAHRAGNLGWMMGHGVANGLDELTLEGGRSVRVCEPGLLLADGFVSMSRLVAEDYDFSRWRLLNLSTCLLGRLETIGTSKELLGFIATLSMLGCRRILSALWQLNDLSAAEFSRQWIRALMEHVHGERALTSNSFATAFKEAVDRFRRAQGGRFDHELYWAPYVLYGLG
jgi:tetratricopeptide (TPR) repeat protein